MKRFIGQAIVLFLGGVALLGLVILLSFQAREKTRSYNLHYSSMVQAALFQTFFPSNIMALQGSLQQKQDFLAKNQTVIGVQDYVMENRAVNTLEGSRRDILSYAQTINESDTPAVFRLESTTVNQQPAKIHNAESLLSPMNMNDFLFARTQMSTTIRDNITTTTPLLLRSGENSLVPTDSVRFQSSIPVYLVMFIPHVRQTRNGVTAVFFDVSEIISRMKLPENIYGSLTGPHPRPASLIDTSAYLTREALSGTTSLTGTTILSMMEKVFYVKVWKQERSLFGISPLEWGIVLLLGFIVIWPCYRVARQERRRVEYLYQRNKIASREIDARNQKLDQEARRYKYLTESTNVIPWSANLSTQRFEYIGPQIEDLTGYPAESWTTQGFWLHHIHPSDRREVIGKGINSLSPGEYTTLNYRIRTANGHVLHIRNMITLLQVKKHHNNKTQVPEKNALRAQGFILDVTEMKMAQKALEEARQQAEEANKSKSEFLANMSHELRTPLNAIIGFSEIMREEIFGPIEPRYKEYSESIHTSGRHLLDLINDVLDLSKIEAGRIELTEEDTDIAQMLRNCKTLLQERASSAGLKIQVKVDENLPHVLVDSRRIKQILINLVSNSIKFTEAGGMLTMAATIDSLSRMVISVSDTGIGMSPEEIPVAMEKFGQIDGELARQHQGTGLGLSIARSLAELHEGSLEIESVKGEGTKVMIYLPETRFRYHTQQQEHYNNMENTPASTHIEFDTPAHTDDAQESSGTNLEYAHTR